jgi:hypothetical protein
MQTAGEKRLAATLGPLDAVIANKFIKTLSAIETPSRGMAPTTSEGTISGAPPNGTFKMGTELMCGGQGKITNTTNLMTVTAPQNERGDAKDTGTEEKEHRGLAPPRLADTNEEATGEDRKRIRLQNKRRKQRLKATQKPKRLWTDHTGTVPYESTPVPRVVGHIETQCVQQDGLSSTRQLTCYMIWPRLDARRARDTTGARTKYGRQSNEGRIDRQHRRRPSNTLQKK